MNLPLTERTTTASEGQPRRRFTVAELEQMTAAGILLEDERIELIGGAIVPMSPKGNHHEIVKAAALNVCWARRLPEDLMLVTETTFRLTPDGYRSVTDFTPNQSLAPEAAPVLAVILSTLDLR
jgi:Uma2 family endonuclease